MTGVALAYLRSPHFQGRSLAIRAGLFLTGIVFTVSPFLATRYKIEWEGVVLMVIVVGILLFVLLSPVLLVKLIQYWTRPQASSG